MQMAGAWYGGSVAGHVQHLDSDIRKRSRQPWWANASIVSKRAIARHSVGNQRSACVAADQGTVHSSAVVCEAIPHSERGLPRRWTFQGGVLLVLVWHLPPRGRRATMLA